MKYVKKHPSLIKEETSNNTTQSQGGSASNTNQQSGPSSSTPLNIDGLFGTIFQKDERQKWHLSDEDDKKMKYIGSQDVKSWSYTPDDTDKDPIIKIVELFQQAHQLYFTPQIPSGRPFGKVSQKTFLEYTYVGHDQKSGGGQWSEERSPNGPFIVNSIFNKWRDGIEKIFQDKEMRKIFSNANFKVKNTTIISDENKETKLENFNFINEAEESGKSSSQGEIIFKFMRDMLDKNKLADFDSNKNKLMYDYFGIKGESVDKVTYNGSNHKPNKRDIEPKTFYWEVAGRPEYNNITKKFFAVATSKQLAFICIALEPYTFKYEENEGGVKKVKDFKGTFFYYWKNNDKVIKEWIDRTHKGYKLRYAKYETIENDHEGIGLLNSKNTSNSPIKIEECEWYLLDVKGGNNSSFENIDVAKNQSGTYPTITGNINSKIIFGDTEIKNYSFLTEGAAGSHFSCDEYLYNKYIKLLVPKVKDKLKNAFLSYKNVKAI